jgi:hypothetical protein
MVQKLMSYGFNEEDVRQKLKEADGNINVAAASLFEKSLLELDGGTDADGAPPSSPGPTVAAEGKQTPTEAESEAAPAEQAGEGDHQANETEATSHATTASEASAETPLRSHVASPEAADTPEPEHCAEELQDDEVAEAAKPLSYDALPGLQLMAVLRCVCLDNLGST